MADTPADNQEHGITPGEAAAAGANPGSPQAAMSRQKMLAGATIGLGALMGAIIAVPVTVTVLAPSFETIKEYPVDIGPTTLYPKVGQGQIPWHEVTFENRPDDTTGLVAAPRLRPQRRRRQVHRDRQHLHAPRLPRAGQRDGLRVPVPRRSVRQRGPAHRRPARAPAEPLRDDGRRQGPPDPRAAVRDGRQPQAASAQGPRPAGRRASSRTSTRLPRRARSSSRCLAHARPPRNSSSMRRSSGSRSAPASSAWSSRSCSARCPATRPGCRRSARRC